ncbi:hypothetical protein P167DRAFT_575437 [Morchella conica CCBAS932]|uniref:Inner kinetochore subunit AME1 domain-containing protein n=1 Tax=Morchella conica CCBAS932 TaxID=1392247 RepID=A0A3N4KLH8_9PEZI|nr:hypothetical protein P167DRAFT_575437 [Morchella conica CCBAS932]
MEPGWRERRNLERLMRQRGAGRPVLSDGFVIRPVGGVSTASVGEAVPPPAPPKATSPPTGQVPPRRTSPRTNPPLSDPAGAARGVISPSPLQEEAPVPLDKPDVTRKSPPRNSPPRGRTPVSSDAPALPIITTTRTSAVAAVTPIARGKRTRQPSPDKFLTTPEADGITKRRLNAAAERRQEKLAMRQRGAGTRKVADIGFTIQPLQPVTKITAVREKESVEAEKELVEEVEAQVQKQVLMEIDGLGDSAYEGGEADAEEGEEDKQNEAGGESEPENEQQEITEDQTIGMVIEEPTQEADGSMIQQIVPGDGESDALVVPVMSPGSRNKRRKVILEGQGQPEQIEDELQPFKNMAHDPVEEVGKETPSETGPKRKRQLIEEGEANGLGQEQQLEPSDLSDSGGEADSDVESLSKSRKNSSTQPQKQPKPKQSKPRPPREEGKTQTYPVIVHRLSKSASYALPPGSNRGGVNPVDVINQVAGEILDKYWEKYAKSNLEKRTIAAFKEEFSCRLLEVTDELERYISLTMRVRQAQKRKAQLVAELLETKRQRGKVAVKMDDVRKAHEMAAKSAETQNHISQTFADVTHTIERGKAREPGELEEGMEGLEAMIKTVAAAVTGGGSDGTGTLATVVEFNRFLERAEAVLRERRY